MLNPAGIFRSDFCGNPQTGEEIGQCGVPVKDIFGNGNPVSRRFLPAGVSPKALTGRLPVSESVLPRVIGDPEFKLFEKDKIDRYIEAVHKVAANVDALRDWEKNNLKIG
jgi:hypothetical protein